MSETDNTVKRMQSIVYDILCEIDKYCRENNITYFLSGGTCLGAVRHHGFIPWDDDGDVMMPRDDYERFVRGFKASDSERFHISSPYNDKKWHLSYTRIWDSDSRIVHKAIYAPKIGVSVDIFPIDGISPSRTKRIVYYNVIKILDTFCAEAIRKKYLSKNRFIFPRKIVSFFAKPIGPHFFGKLMNSLSKRTDYNTSEYVACSLPAHYGERETIEKKYMCEPVDMPFEGSVFCVPSGYDRYLTNLYGKDYMKIPDPPEDGTHLDAWSVYFRKKGSANEQRKRFEE